MDSSVIISGNFEIDEKQKVQFDALGQLYADWNDKINVVSRKDIDNIYLRHIMHSLMIAKYISFKKGSSILDLGTGGGLPGIPLAIMFPEVQFTLIDGTGKKIKVVNDIIEKLGLENAKGIHERAEYMKTTYDFVVSRAVAKIEQLKEWSFPLVHDHHKSSIPNGLICLKGGMLKTELSALSKKDYYEKIPLTKWYDHPVFEDKYLIYLQR